MNLMTRRISGGLLLVTATTCALAACSATTDGSALGSSDTAGSSSTSAVALPTSTTPSTPTSTTAPDPAVPTTNPSSALPTTTGPTPELPTTTETAPAPTPGTVTRTETVTPPSPNRGTNTGSQSGVTVPAGFVGEWDGHGRVMYIRADGSVVIEFRTYVDCSATVTTACDRIVNNTITDGGQVRGRITAVHDSTTVTLTITSTNDPQALPSGPTRLGRDVGHDAVAVFSGQLSGTAFCGPDSPLGYCGA